MNLACEQAPILGGLACEQESLLAGYHEFGKRTRVKIRAIAISKNSLKIRAIAISWKGLIKGQVA